MPVIRLKRPVDGLEVRGNRWGHRARIRGRVLVCLGFVIVALHVATGAAAGALTDSRLAALALGPVLHLAGDLMPHQDIPSTRFELASGVGAVLLLGVRRGPLDPATLGAITASAEDLEHVLPLPRPGGRKLFPSHRNEDWHNRGGVPAWVQLVVAGAIIGALLRR